MTVARYRILFIVSFIYGYTRYCNMQPSVQNDEQTPLLSGDTAS